MASYDPAWLDRMYNNRARVPDHALYFGRWASESVAARAEYPCLIDRRFGPANGEALDIFSAPKAGAPVLVFIHGGYWRSLDKSDHSFVAPAFRRHGACVVVPNYALCPGTAERPVRVADIALQMVRALEWTWRHIAQHGGDPSRITVVGHSAGGHLAAMMMGCDWKKVAPDLPANLVRNALSISGLHDMRPIAHTPFLADALRLSDAEAVRLSPALWPAPAQGKLYAVAGGNESEEFVRQAQVMQEAWGPAIVPKCEILPRLDHFSIVDSLADPEQALHALA
ncbi:MAG: alpha/beta fold hydrolase [Gammaproteobacteria bacterium]|nr:alpha/beta fold hydrolase [Gammaproteobacteria bacterium]